MDGKDVRLTIKDSAGKELCTLRDVDVWLYIGEHCSLGEIVLPQKLSGIVEELIVDRVMKQVSSMIEDAVKRVVQKTPPDSDDDPC